MHDAACPRRPHATAPMDTDIDPGGSVSLDRLPSPSVPIQPSTSPDLAFLVQLGPRLRLISTLSSSERQAPQARHSLRAMRAGVWVGRRVSGVGRREVGVGAGPYRGLRREHSRNITNM